MASIEMGYILIDKKKDGSRDAEKIALDYMKKSNYVFEDGRIIIDNNRDSLSYTFEHKKGSKRYYLSLVANMHVTKAWKIIEEIDSFLSGEINKYVEVYKSYDGLSASFCSKLYPCLGEFERKIRHLILLVLTKAYGEHWIHNTVPKKKQKDLKGKEQGKFNIKEVLELFDLFDLENFLFGEREINYRDFLESELSSDKLELLSKDEIVVKLDLMRAQSLWEKNFSDIGDEQDWKNNISEIRKCRNKVAHHRSMSKKEYDYYLKNLKKTNGDIDEAIEKIQIKDFTDDNRVDILLGFRGLLETSLKISEVYSAYNFESLFANISSVIKSISKITIPSTNYIDAVNRTASVIQNINIPAVSSDVVKGMSEMANAISKINYPLMSYNEILDDLYKGDNQTGENDDSENNEDDINNENENDDNDINDDF